MTPEAVRYRLGFSESHRAEAATLYDQAFGRKFAGAIPDPAKRRQVIQHSLQPGHAFTAFAGDELVGLAGVHSRAGSLTSGITAASLFRLLGPVAGLRAVLLLGLLSRHPGPGELLMDGIAVRADQRGLGVGGHLLDAVVMYAAHLNLHTVRLSVIDGNDGARRLYERKGFRASGHDSVPYLSRVLGFSGATTMVLQVSQGGA